MQDIYAIAMLSYMLPYEAGLKRLTFYTYEYALRTLLLAFLCSAENSCGLISRGPSEGG